jgi:saccharopine dehydrogenase-like NADP-dependent oxidoreductase
MTGERRFAVLGGAGAIGRIVVRDLFESHQRNHIVIADYNEPAAQALIKYFGDRRVQAEFIDIRRPSDLARLLNKTGVVINCLQHDFNLLIMRAALKSRVHYVDLGGLFYWTRKQLRLNEKFRKAKLTAIIGMGCAPGITNVLTAYAVSKLTKVQSVKIRVGSRDFNPPFSALYFPYSPQTIIEELTLKPWIFRNGQFKQIAPRTGWEETDFPKPIGKIWTLWTRHSEIATLPLAFKAKGLRDCDFKVSFDPDFVEEIMNRLHDGMTVQDFKNLNQPPNRQPNDYEISRVTADGIFAECHAAAKPEWQASAGDADTACPASIAAQMIAGGLIKESGVRPPEIAVPIQPFFAELQKRGLKIKTGRL